MLKIHQIMCPVGTTLGTKHIASKLHCNPSDILSFDIDRESLDARKKPLRYSYTVFAEVRNEKKYLKLRDVDLGEKEIYVLPPTPSAPTQRPIIVGFGPAGMYAALILAECGMRPIIIERGMDVDTRTCDVEKFFHEGILSSTSNVQFGEGGAGTFSDGKLTTRIKNHRIRKVLEEFVEAGANPAILYQQRAHLGTDVLRSVVKNIRKKIISLGGEVRFDTQLLSLIKEDNTITGIHTNHGNFSCSYVILAAGHSASDTYETLYDQGLSMTQKDFAVGVRVEHPQALINKNQYGMFSNHPALSAASYQLTYHCSNGRGVYSFCMCPGGVVVPAPTQANTLVVNGMSYSARDKKNANSAILVQIPRSDFDHGHPLDGFTFQKELEKAAFRPGYQAPCMNLKDYVNHTVSEELVLESSYPLTVHLEDMHKLFSDEVNTSLEEGFKAFDRKIHGFLDQGIMVGVESRSSSPIRIPREEDGVSVSIRGLYPAGEGAGYAGGIVSSAVDGIKQAENILADMIRNEH